MNAGKGTALCAYLNIFVKVKSSGGTVREFVFAPRTASCCSGFLRLLKLNKIVVVAPTLEVYEPHLSMKKKPVKRVAAPRAVSTSENTVLPIKHGTKL